MTTLTQRFTALEGANRIRVRRAEVKREIRDLPYEQGKTRAVEVLEAPEPACETMSAFDLLLCCRRVGERRARTLLVRAGVPEYKRLQDLTVRQRGRLAELLGRG